jgi:hypothetical protein
MIQASWFRTFGLAAIPLTLSLTLAAQTGDTAAIQQKLYTQFKLTTMTADRSDIVTAGDVVVIHKPGLMMYAVASPLPPSNTYKNGKIGQGWGGFGKDMLITIAVPGAGTANDYPHRPFVPEEKCWVTGIQVQKDGILFQLYSDPYNYIRYYANLKIPFPNKKQVPSADEALKLVAEVLTVVPPDDQGGQQGADAATGTVMSATGADQQQGIAGEYTATGGSRILLLPDGTFTKFVGSGQGQGKYLVAGGVLQLTFASTGSVQTFTTKSGNLVDLNTQMVWARTGDAPAPAAEAAPEAAPAPLPEIAPPPPPADAPPPAPASAPQSTPNTPPPTISIGQTMDQVTTGFGQPLKVANLGGKTIFYYKDMKVTFTNGKVSDVE